MSEPGSGTIQREATSQDLNEIEKLKETANEEFATCRRLIHELALAMRSGAFTGRLAQTVHAYPTWSTGIRSTAAQFFFDQQGRSARPARVAPAPPTKGSP